MAVLVKPLLDPAQVEAKPATDFGVRNAVLGHKPADVALGDMEQVGQLGERQPSLLGVEFGLDSSGLYASPQIRSRAGSKRKEKSGFFFGLHYNQSWPNSQALVAGGIVARNRARGPPFCLPTDRLLLAMARPSSFRGALQNVWLASGRLGDRKVPVTSGGDVRGDIYSCI
jgi:hypothetical protein